MLRCLFYKKWLVLFLLFSAYLSADDQGWQRPSYISENEWQRAAPYLLPKNHPACRVLDQIFSKRRAIESKKSLKKVGFESVTQNFWKQIVVCKHPKLSGYVIKTYLDSQIGYDELRLFVNRIKAAERVHEAILAFNAEKYLKVPKKWLYALPESDRVYVEGKKKNFILIAEDMKIVDHSVNRRSWFLNVDKKRLKMVYHVITAVGLFDSTLISNIPFCKDGKIAFVDTEHSGGDSIPYGKMMRSLNREMRDYWVLLTQTNGNCD